MADSKDDKNLSAPGALKKWREAERVIAVAHRGTVAARNAAAAAKTGAKAAAATAKASKSALAAARRAEGSAANTARAAKSIVALTFVEVVHAQLDDESAKEDEVAAHGQYREALARASEPPEPSSAQPPGRNSRPRKG